jgi:hypothetical protein
MPQIIVSQSPQDHIPKDDLSPPVRASAMCEASRLIADVIGPRLRIDGDRIIVPIWAMRSLAHEIARIAHEGLDTEDGMAPHADPMGG